MVVKIIICLLFCLTFMNGYFLGSGIIQNNQSFIIMVLIGSLAYTILKNSDY